jgi:hypothetical protein
MGERSVDVLVGRAFARQAFAQRPLGVAERRAGDDDRLLRLGRRSGVATVAEKARESSTIGIGQSPGCFSPVMALPKISGS